MGAATIRPNTSEVVREIPAHTSKEVEGRVQQAHEAFLEMNSTAFAARAA